MSRRPKPSIGAVRLSFRVARFQFPPAELELLLRREVLVPEEDDAPLGDEQRQLVLLLVGQLPEIDAMDLSSDGRRQVLDL